MKKSFNLSGYRELLKFKASFENFYSILDEKNRQLLRYEASVIQQMKYDRKDEYFLVIHNYLTGR